MIERPGTGSGHPDRGIACEEAMEAEIQRVMDAAFAAGWSHQEITTAVMELANEWALALASNAQTEANFERANGRKFN